MTILEMKDYCKSRKITYEELSQASGVSKGVISNIFAGYVQSPRIDTVNKIEYGLKKLCGFEISEQPTLTDHEKRLIAMYRRLVPAMQRNIYEMIESLTDATANQPKEKKIAK